MIEQFHHSLEIIGYTIINWSSSLVKITTDKNGNEKMDLIGSGTFIKINTVQGILTANHVIDLLSDKSDKVGLILVEGRHRYVIQRYHIDLLHIAIPTNEEDGPDLAFIKIPPEIAREISHYKGFINLSADRDEILSKPPLLNEGIWFVSGTPNEFTMEGPKIERPSKIFRPFCWTCEANRTYKKGDYDYIEADVHYDRGENLPISFGGISGGGLWQVIVQKKGKDELIPLKFILSGVAYYQSKLSDNLRFVKFHGRESIYLNLFTKLGF
jgi:hypothetical protein